MQTRMSGVPKTEEGRARRRLSATQRCERSIVDGQARRFHSHRETSRPSVSTDPTVRGQGIGRAVLARLEEAARDFGAKRLVVETVIYQGAARKGIHRTEGPLIA